MKRILFPLLLSLGVTLTACGTDANTETYALGSQAYLDVAENAQVTFEELSDGNTEVTIDFGGALESDFDAHPAHIHMGEAGSSGEIVVTLDSVDTATGMSTTTVTNFDGEDGTPGAGDAVTYEELIAYEGYVNVHLSAENLDVVIASANIGANAGVALPEVPSIADLVTSQAEAEEGAEFTILLQALSITEADNADVAALAATLGDDAAGPFTVLAPTDAAFEAFIADSDDIADAAALLALPNLADVLSYHVLSGATVRSQVVAAASEEGGTELETSQGSTLTLSTNDDGAILVNDAVAISGSEEEVVAATNITASNGVVHAIETVLLPPEAPENATYTLSEVDGSGVSGSAIFTRVSDAETEVTLNVMGDAVVGNHPSHIHMGTSGSGGPIVITLESVNAEGVSVTTVTKFDDTEEDGSTTTGEDVTYEELLEYNGYINVHESPDNLANIISTTNIGANAE